MFVYIFVAAADREVVELHSENFYLCRTNLFVFATAQYLHFCGMRNGWGGGGSLKSVTDEFTIITLRTHEKATTQYRRT